MSDLPAELLRPHPDRLDPADPGYGEILAAHEQAIGAGQLQYRDPRTGLFVMTALKHWRRGFCCEFGCRHCPYLPR